MTVTKRSKSPDIEHLPVIPPTEEFRNMQKAQRTRQRAAVRDVQPTINRINKDQVKGGINPSRA